ncbi:MAG: FAD-dependent oxidoreductase [Verrucomicrobia bacterium]|nr:MAG: FAD-dependent oxidoreductase [Verrucomicrobiota bacterium]
MTEISEAGTKSKTPVVVIVGGGFAGLAAARSLKKAPVRVVLIDRSNHHLFQPLLYQVATSGLAPADIAQPIRSILRDQANVEVYLDEVMKIDTADRLVVTADLTFRYDYLILACGARHSYFGKDEWEQYAPGLKTLNDAISIRHRILAAFEVAEKASDPEERKQATTFIIVGGGPTGVEMAGAISELARFTLKKDFRHINSADARVILIEAAPRVLPVFDPSLSEKALQQLRQLHVDVRLNAKVTKVTEDYVEVDGVPIPTRTVIWAAGNVASPLGKQLGVETDRQGRVVVNPDLGIPGHPEVFVVGDMAFAKRANGAPVPGVSPAALQGGYHVAENIIRILKGEPTQPFHYFDKGSMATIGRNAAVADLHVVKFGGLFAWLAWVFVHLYFLIGFKNRVRVFFGWVFSYWTYSKGSRLIQVQPKDGALLHNPPADPLPPQK